MFTAVSQPTVTPYHRTPGCSSATVNPGGVSMDEYKLHREQRVPVAESSEPSYRGSDRRRLRSCRRLHDSALTARRGLLAAAA